MNWGSSIRSTFAGYLKNVSAVPRTNTDNGNITGFKYPFRAIRKNRSIPDKTLIPAPRNAS